MVSVAVFCPGDPSSNPGLFAASNSKKKIEFSRIIKACSTLASNPAMGGILVGIKK